MFGLWARSGSFDSLRAIRSELWRPLTKTETRFAGYDEVKESNGKRDRAKEEIFLRENQVPLNDLPLEELNQAWLKKHLPALKSQSKRDATVENFLSSDTLKQQFWIKWLFLMLAGFVYKFYSVLKGRQNQAKKQICQAKIMEGQVFQSLFAPWGKLTFNGH